MAPPICKFWQRGDCRYGDHCKFDHPRNLPRNENRFAALQTSNNNSRSNPFLRAGNDGANLRPNSGAGFDNFIGRSTPPQNPTSTLNRDVVIADLSTERPQWILSAYAPAPKAGAQLFGGPLREQSFEEMRLHHYEGVARNNLTIVIQDAQALVQKADAQMQEALHNVDGAIEFICKAENEHPNRIDILRDFIGAPTPTTVPPAGPFGPSHGIPMPSGSQAGQTSSLSTNPNPFNQPKFSPAQTIGATPNPFGEPKFGQTLTLGPKPNPFGEPTFGKTPTLGAKPNPFSPSNQQTSTFPVFSNPSTSLGQKHNPFVPAGGSTISQVPSDAPAPFSRYAKTPNPFRNPSTSSVTSPSPFALSNPFERHIGLDFGRQKTQPQSGFFSDPTTSSDFPESQAPTNPFGSPVQPPQINPLVQGARAPPVANLTRPLSAGISNGQQNPLVRSSQQSQPRPNGVSSTDPYNPNSQFQHPNLQSYAHTGSDGKLTMFKGKQVLYKGEKGEKGDEAGVLSRDGSWEKIWFPNGPPPYYTATEVDERAYTEDTKEAYLHLRETGTFKDGIMPLLPPKREWCLWDF